MWIHKHCISVKALQTEQRAVMDEWMFLSWIVFTQQLTHTHTPHIILSLCNVQYFVLSTSPSPWLPHTFIFISSLHHEYSVGVICDGYWQGGVPSSFCQLPLCGISRHSEQHRKRQKTFLSFVNRTSSAFCALWCASHASFYNVCVCPNLSSKFKLTPV